MGFIKELIDDPVKTVRESLSFFYGATQEQMERNNACDALIARIDEALGAAEAIFSSSPTECIDPDLGHAWQEENRDLLIDIQPHKISTLKKAAQFKQLTEKQQELDFAAKTLLQRIRRHNINLKE